MQNFGLIRFTSHVGQRCGAHEHRYIPDKIAWTGNCEDLLLPVARLENFQLAAQDHREPDVALARFKYQFAALHDAALAKGFQHRELPIIELWKGYALGVAVKLLVFVEFGHGQIRLRDHTRSSLYCLLRNAIIECELTVNLQDEKKYVETHERALS